MADSGTSQTVNTQQSNWHYTLLVISVLALIGSAMWLFLIELSFEPLLGVLAGIGGLTAYYKNTSRFVDFTIAIIIVIFFLFCTIMILATLSAESKFLGDGTQVILVSTGSTFAAIAILGAIIFIARESLTSTDQSRLAGLIAWAYSGKEDEQALKLIAYQSIKVFVTMIVWSVTISLVWISALVLITMVDVVFGSKVYGTANSLIQYGLFGGLIGGIFGLFLGIYRLNYGSSSQP